MSSTAKNLQFEIHKLPLYMWSAMDTIVSNAILQTCFSKPRKNSWTTINTHITNDLVVQHVHHLRSFFSSFFPVSDPLSLQTIVEKVIQSSFLECSSTSLMTWLGDDLSSVVPVKRRLFGNACVHLYKQADNYECIMTGVKHLFFWIYTTPYVG